MSALRSGDAVSLGGVLANDLQRAAVSLRPGLAMTLDVGDEYGALGALVSGSGPTCAFLARDEEHALDLAVALTASGTCRTVDVRGRPGRPGRGWWTRDRIPPWCQLEWGPQGLRMLSETLRVRGDRRRAARSRRRSPSPSPVARRSGRTAATSAPKSSPAPSAPPWCAAATCARDARCRRPACSTSQDGERLIMPSDNGSVISHAALMSGLTVVAGSLRNASAVARWLNGRFATVGLVPAGEQWPDGAMRVCYEDLIGAGAIAGRAASTSAGTLRLTPEVLAAAAAFRVAGLAGRRAVGPRPGRPGFRRGRAAGRAGRRRRRRPGPAQRPLRRGRLTADVAVEVRSVHWVVEGGQHPAQQGGEQLGVVGVRARRGSAALVGQQVDERGVHLRRRRPR